MTRKIKIFIALGCALLVSLIGLITYLYTIDKNNKELTIYGNVDIRQVDLGFRVYGRIQTLMFDEGDHVNAGQLMAVLDTTPYEEELAKTKAQLGVVKATYKKLKAQFDKRFKITSGAISKEDYDDALYNLKAAKAAVRQTKALKDIAATNLKDAHIYCPTNGIILSRIREPGSVVNVGEPAFTLAVDTPVWIRAYVTEPNLGRIYFNMPADIFTDSNTTYKGHIGFISPTAEFTPKNVETTDLRTDLVYRLRVYVDNKDRLLKQGMPVTVKFNLQKRE
jgi:HlyD family secretion protein